MALCYFLIQTEVWGFMIKDFEENSLGMHWRWAKTFFSVCSLLPMKEQPVSSTGKKHGRICSVLSLMGFSYVMIHCDSTVFDALKLCWPLTVIGFSVPFNSVNSLQAHASQKRPGSYLNNIYYKLQP